MIAGSVDSEGMVLEMGQDVPLKTIQLSYHQFGYSSLGSSIKEVR